jgi:hypothetical protein
MGNNKINILSFIIPMTVLSLVAFTSVEDDILGDFKSKLNLVSHKTIYYMYDHNNTVRFMREDFLGKQDKYEAYIEKHFGKDPDVKTYVMNYFYLYNERNIFFVENHKIAKQDAYDEDAMKETMVERDKLATIQYKCAQRIFKRKDVNPVDFYKSISRQNQLISKYAWAYIHDQDYTSGFDDNTTCVAKKLY